MLTVAALCVRFAWVFLKPWLAGDSQDYLTIAKNIRFHRTFSLTESATGPWLPTTFRPPLYPLFVSLFWFKDAPPITPLLVAQAFLGATTVALVYLIARDRFSRSVALLSASFMIIAPMSGYFTAAILTETLFTFLMTLATFLWGRGFALAAGSVLGIAALTRPVVLPFLIIVPALSLLPGNRSTRNKYLRMALMGLAISSIWIVRNGVVFRHFIPIVSSGWGTNLLYGTIDTELVGIKVWTGTDWANLDIRKHPLLQTDPGLDETEKDHVFWQRGVQRIELHPFHWIVVRSKQYPKLFLDTGDYLLGRYNVPIRDAFARRELGVLAVKTLFLTGDVAGIVFAIWGFILVRSRWRELTHLWLFPIFLLIMQIPMWAEARYTIPIMPIVAIFASVALVEFWKRRQFFTS